MFLSVFIAVLHWFSLYHSETEYFPENWATIWTSSQHFTSVLESLLTTLYISWQLNDPWLLVFVWLLLIVDFQLEQVIFNFFVLDLPFLSQHCVEFLQLFLFGFLFIDVADDVFHGILEFHHLCVVLLFQSLDICFLLFI